MKGAILGMLDRSFRNDDEVVLIAFRGTDAQVLLEPCRQVEDAERALEYLPTGGRTPLVHALELAKIYLTSSTLLIVLSDGRANVALRDGIRGRRLWKAQGSCTEDPSYPVQCVSQLADALRASSTDLPSLERLDVLEIKRSTA